MSAFPVQTSTPSIAPSHDEDFHLWTHEQASLLEERRFDELDLGNLIDEVRALGASEKREIRSRLSVVLMHLLKWRYQPGRRSSSWMATIREQREELSSVLADNLSLTRYPAQAMDAAYRSARLKAARDTGLDVLLFPEALPFRIEQVLDPDFLPRHPDDPTS